MALQAQVTKPGAGQNAIPMIGGDANVTVSPETDNVLVTGSGTHTYSFSLGNSGTGNAVAALSITGCTGAVNTCSVSPSSVSLPKNGGSGTATVTYHTAATGTGQITMLVNWGSGNNTSATLNVTMESAQPSVTASPTVWTAESVSTNDPGFTITNNGNTAAQYTLTPSCTGNLNSYVCTVSPSTTVSVAPHGSTTATLNFQTGAYGGGNGTITLTAQSPFGETGSEAVTIVILSEKVSVATQTAPTPPNPSGSATYGFTINATGNNTSPVSYSLVSSCSGALSCGTTPSPSSVSITPSSPGTANVVATAASNLAGGTGTVTLSATFTDSWGHVYTSQNSDSVNVPDIRTAAVQVTPDGSTTYNEANVSTNYLFKVHNAGNVAAQYILSATCTGTVGNACTSRYGSVTIQPNDTAFDAPVDFTTLGAGQNASVSLHATVTATWGPTYADDGSVQVVTLAPTVQVSPVLASLNTQTNSSGTYTFNVHNVGTSGQITYTLQITGCTAPLTSCSAPGSVTVAQGADSIVSVSFQTQGAAGTGQISLRAYKTLVNTYESTAAGTVNVSSRLSLSTAFMNNDDQDMSLCVASCFAMTASRSTVPYYTLDTPRSVTLVYNSDRAFPRPFIYADVSVPSAPAAVSSYTLEVKRLGVNLPFVNGETKLTFAGTSSPGTTYRLAGQIDMSSYGTMIDTVTLVVTAHYANDESDVTSVKTQLMLVNDQSSEIARGWAIAGLQQLSYEPEGGGGASGYMARNGDGSATYFASDGAMAPDFSTLTLNGSVWTRAYPDGSRVLFNASGLMTAAIDRLGRQTTFQYGGSDGFHLVSITEPMRSSGSSTSAPYLALSYDGNGRLAGITETGGANGRTTNVTVDANGYLTRITDPDGGYDSYGYDGSGRLHTITDRRGNTTTYNYDTAWKLSQIVSPSVPLDAGGGSTTTGIPTTSLSSWQAVGVPSDTTAITPAQLTPPSSVVAHIISPTNDTTTITPDRWGQVLSVVDPIGHTTTVERSGIFATVLHHPNGSVDSASYSNGLITAVREAGHSTVHIRYGVFAQSDSTWGGGRAGERIFLNSSNGNADSVRHVGPTPNVLRYTYDALGRVLSVRDEAGHTTHYGYDAVWGNADSVTNAVGSIVHAILDSHGRTASYIDGVDSSVTFAYDSLNRQIAVYQGGSGTTVQTVFDGLLPTTVIDRNSNHTTTHYNALGWATDRCDPTGHCTYYRYDASGRLTSETNRRGQRIDRTYDRLGRLLVKSGDSTSTDTFAYNADEHGVTAWNATETDSLRVHFGTSTLGRADTVTTHVNGTRFQVIHGDLSSWAGVDSTVITTTAPSVTFRKRYLYADTTTGLVSSYNDGFSTMTYSYTSDRLQSATTNVSGTLNTLFLPSHAVEWTQFSASSLTNLNRSQAYDHLLRINQIATVFQSPGNGTSFAYDSLGRLAQTQILVGCTTAVADTISGMTWGSCSGHSVPNVYTYDNEGNRTSQGGTYDTGNRVLTSNGFTYTHDLDGNIIRKYNSSTGEDHQYTWSSDGRLTDVYYNDGLGDSPLIVHYDYNAYGQPVLRSLDSSLDRVWVYDRGQLLGEFNAANGEQRVAEYLYNPGVDDPYGVITGATTPTRIDYLKLDESGSVLGAYEGTTITMTASYDDWGVPSVGVGQAGNLLWKSLHHDEYTGLYYVRARWYDPSLGRFMSEDPAGFAGGVNPYTFADDDPINGSDPSGMFGGSIMNAYNSCGIYCQFASDLYHNRGPSKVPHATLKGANPGCVFCNRVYFIGVHGSGIIGAGPTGGVGLILWSNEGPGIYTTVGGGFGGAVGAGIALGSSTNLSSFRGWSNGSGASVWGISGSYSGNQLGSTYTGGFGPQLGSPLLLIGSQADRTYTKTLTFTDFEEAVMQPIRLWIDQGINEMNAASGRPQ